MACRIAHTTQPRSHLPAGRRSRLAATSPALAAAQWNRLLVGSSCRRRAAPPLAAASEAASGSSTGAGDAAPGSSSNRGSATVPMRNIEPNSSATKGNSGSGGSGGGGGGSSSAADSSSSSSSSRPSEPPQRTRPSGRLAWLAEAVQGIKGSAALRRILTVLFMFGVGSALSLASSRGRCAGPQELMYSEFLALVRSGNVRACRFEESSSRITFDLQPHSSAAVALAPCATQVAVGDPTAVSRTAAVVTVHGSGPTPRQFYTKRLTFDTQLVPTLMAAGVEFGVLKTSVTSVLVRVLGSALLLWIPLMPLFFVLRQFLRSQAGTSKKRKPSLSGSEVPTTTFADVAGMESAKRELAECVACLKNSSKFARLGAKMPSGVLLSGPPGTGKTLLARAVAGEAGVPFFAVSASEFVELFVGRGAARIRELFAEARRKAPCVVFIDELDAVGGKRGIGLNEERDQTLNQLLTELDGFDGRPGVLLLAATNRPDVLDGALLRPGRLSRKVVVPLPDEEARAAILAVHLRRVPLASQHDRDLACEAVAKITAGFSGADLSNVVNEAAFLAARSATDAVGLPELVEAVQRTRFGVNGGSGLGAGLGLPQRLRGWLVDAMSSGKRVQTSPYSN